MSKSAERPALFERLRAGLEEGVQFARDELTLRTTVVPARPPDLRAREVLRLRQQLKMSQGVFARMLNVSSKTVQSWEQGERRPSRAALRLLQILGALPEEVCQVIGVRRLGSRANTAGSNDPGN
jgi:putative transcriptional regulator